MNKKILSLSFVFLLWESHPSHTFEPSSKKDPSNLWQIGEETKSLPLEEKRNRQFERDKDIFLNTMFPGPSDAPSLSPKDQEKVQKEQDFTKRLFLTMALGRVKYKDRTEPTIEKEWLFPVASLLGHGQRILMEIEGSYKPQEVVNFLASGNPQKKEDLVKNRLAASHGVVFEKESQTLKEVKLNGFQGTLRNIADGFKGKHQYVNIALGGIGHKDARGNIIAPGGKAYDPQGNKIKKQQHGHVYLRSDVFTPTKSSLLIGLEGSAPGKTNMFGKTHTAKGAFHDPSLETSPTGGQKWSQLGEKTPLEIDGKRISLDKNKFTEIQKISQVILSRPPEEQKKIFEKILSLDGPQAHQYLKTVAPSLSSSPTPHQLAQEAVHKRSQLRRSKV